MRDLLRVELLSLVASPVAAQSPNTDRSFREGANHRLGQGQVDNLAKVLAAIMTWFIEWPNIDGKFATLAGSQAAPRSDRSDPEELAVR